MATKTDQKTVDTPKVIEEEGQDQKLEIPKQGDNGIMYIVNPGGTVHDVTVDHAKALIEGVTKVVKNSNGRNVKKLISAAKVGYRPATDGEIKAYIELQSQTEVVNGRRVGGMQTTKVRLAKPTQVSIDEIIDNG